MTNKASDSTEFALQQEKLLVNRIIESLKSEDYYGLLGDSRLDLTFWDEICIQVQFDKSIIWEHYESVVNSHIHSALKHLPSNIYDVLEEYYSEELMLADDDQNPDAKVSDAEMANYIMQELILLKARWENSENISAYKEDYWNKQD